MKLFKFTLNVAMEDYVAEPLDTIRETVHSHVCDALCAEVTFSSDAAEKHIDYPDLDMDGADANEETERWQARAREELEKWRI